MTKRSISILLLSAMLTGMISCGKTEVPPTDDTTDSTPADSSTAPVEYAYPYPEEGFGGETIDILTRDDIWGYMCHLDVEETTGEVVDDAQFDRNRLVESKLDVIIKDHALTTNWNATDAIKSVQQAVLADDCPYDAVFLPLSNCGDAIQQGIFYNLFDVETIQLDKDWWYSTYNDQITINDALYTAVGGLHLMIQEGFRVLGFNKQMMEDLKLEIPYQTVRDGKWTLDEYNKYLSAAANLNGDESAAWDPNGNTVYGMANNGQQFALYLLSAGEPTIENIDGVITNTGGTDRWYRVIDKLTSILTTNDAKIIHAENVKETYEDGYVYQIYTHGRSLFCFNTFMHLRQEFMRNCEFEYGILPFPKFDEDQEEYITETYENTISVFLPSTLSSEEANKVGTVLDAMAYEGERTVLPEYWSNAIEQKGLRDEESIEMAGIISSNIIPPLYKLFKIGDTAMSKLTTDALSGNASAASTMEAEREKIQVKIDELMNTWGKIAE